MANNSITNLIDKMLYEGFCCDRLPVDLNSLKHLPHSYFTILANSDDPAHVLAYRISSALYHFQTLSVGVAHAVLPWNVVETELWFFDLADVLLDNVDDTKEELNRASQ